MPDRRMAVAGPSGLVCVLLVAAGVGADGSERAARHAERLDVERDRVVRSVPVPSADDRHGDVRVIVRGGARVVQTLLESKLLRRVVAEVREKELRNWPPGSTGHDDSARYVEAVSAAQQRIWHRHLRRSERAPAKQRLVIELIRDADAALVAIYEPDSAGGAGAGEPTHLLELSPAYVERNQLLIVADSFGLGEAEAARLLALEAP